MLRRLLFDPGAKARVEGVPVLLQPGPERLRRRRSAVGHRVEEGAEGGGPAAAVGLQQETDPEGG